MAGVTGTAQIDDAVEKFLAESRFTLQERPGVVARSIRNETLPTGQGPSVNIPKYGTVNTFALTEGVDMTQAQQITDQVMTITPAEFGAQVVLTDLMLDQSKDEFFAVAGRILGESFDRQREQTLVDDFDAYSSVIGSGGTSMTAGHIMAGRASIAYNGPADSSAGRGGEPAPGRVYCVQTPAAFHTVKKGLSGAVSSVGATTAVAPGTIQGFTMEFSIDDVTCRSSINISKDSSDDAKGGLFSEDAQILVNHGGGPGAERERDASLRAWEVNFVGRWARGEYDDDWGREAIFDSALPTS
jgi:hypothetical protein